MCGFPATIQRNALEVCRSRTTYFHKCPLLGRGEVMLGTNDAWHRAGEPQKVGEGIMTLLDSLEKSQKLVDGWRDNLHLLHAGCLFAA